MLLGRLWRMSVLLLSGFLLAGCLPSSHSQLDEEKEPHYLAGKSRVSSMDFHGAVEAFTKAVEVNPRSGAAHLELGWLYDQKESDPAAAIYHYSKHLQLRPQADNADTIKTRILACKQELARTVSLGPVTQAMQREFEQLALANKRLQEDLEKCRAYAESLQSLTNRAGAAGSSPAERRLSSAQAGDAGVRTGATRVSNPAGGPVRPPRAHTVKSGETPTQIARQYGVKLDALLSANPKLDPRRMKVGDVVRIP
jgi:tetratricopeptide (TPR) repeat protein